MGQVGMATNNSYESRTIKLENPEIGKPMPDFTLDYITNYKTTKASLNDFKGKWLILDLWFKGCVVCIKSFPHVNELQEKFKDKVQFLLVGYNANRVGGNSIVQVYDDFNKEKKLKNLVSAYDSIIIKKWNVWSFPCVFIINPEGTLVAITDGRDLTEEKMRQLIDRKSVLLYPKDREKFSAGINNMHPKPSDSLILFQSSLTKFTNQDFFLQSIDYQLNSDIYIRKGYKVAGIPLNLFYNLAYFGKHHWIRGDSLYEKVYRQPILNLKDTSLFIWSDRQLKGLYNYSLDVPKELATKEGLMKRMQGDLEGYFGYKVTVENRKMPIWKLTAKNYSHERLKTKGGPIVYKGEITGVTFGNFKWSQLPYLLDRYINEMSLVTLIDETGITGNVDLKIDALMSDIHQVKRELQKYGLDLVKEEREMKVLVISDQK
ncbi:Peroxiredoxin [Chitinophaga niabensis]|uniref:Peroxiredoxin n=2 Tax=Chitinophaga niabensis TaxID=536979 RepID=A0A1N6KAV7_9BACT|nr:Peroxiredoxin [Chitinophaga niabensis]